MRKFFYGLGVISAFVIIAGGIGFFILARNGAALDSASKTYVENAVVVIAGNWVVDELLKRASPRLKSMAKPDELRNLFDAAKSALGPLQQYQGSKGQAMMSVVNSQTSVSAQYVAKGSFAKGDAELRIALVKSGDNWMIEGFHINSSALMQRLVGVRS
jgi:hypothetical protein